MGRGQTLMGRRQILIRHKNNSDRKF